MRAAVFYGRRDVRVEDRPEPDPGPGDLLLEVHAAGICGTDAAEFAHGPRMFPIGNANPITGHIGPMVPGHEIAGRVVAKGAETTGFAVGDLVASGAGISCGACRACRAGRTSLCERYATVGLQRDGALAQFCLVPASTCVNAGELGLCDDSAALAQPMAIAVHAMRRGAPPPGADVLVVGAGGIGAFLVHALAEHDARVTVSDLAPSRLDIASRLGAAVTFGPDDGFEPANPAVIFEVTGTRAGLDAALAAAGRGTRLVLVGLHEQPRELDLRALTLAEVDVIGTNAHTCAVDLPEALGLLAARPEIWTDVAPRALSLDRVVPDGLEPLVAGLSPSIKTLVDPWATQTRPTVMRSAAGAP